MDEKPNEEEDDMRKDDTFEDELGRGYAYMTDAEVARDVQRRIDAETKRREAAERAPKNRK